MQNSIPAQGATAELDGVEYAVWSPQAREVKAVIQSAAGETMREVLLQKEGDGYFRGRDVEGRPGDLYKVSLDGQGPLPPPAARFQPQGVHGPASVTDARSFRWTDHGWRRPAFRDLIIYELHLGTFTPEGTYRAAVEKLPYLRDLGVTALEIMPVADFPGERGWGYDGVQLYAPARCYGTPDDLRALVDAAHAAGLAVILDVVYNHLGPDGNFLPQLSPFYFSGEDKTPWGDAINFGHGHSQPVRDFYRGNVAYWMEEFHFDGFRLDATHAIIDQSEKHILQEMAELVQSRGGYIIAEDERNEARFIKEREQGGFGFNAVWADDFHHTVEVAIIEASVYSKDFTGELRELVQALREGWYYSGQIAPKSGKRRGTPASDVPPERFVYCISNHDQVGNRALGERLNHLVKPATYRAESALLLLVPYTPLLFMGQEFAASTPFQYFTDHHGELGRLVEEGRRKEFADAFESSSEVPSPQDPATFERSKLRWDEIDKAPHAQVLALYREFIKLRQANSAFRPTGRQDFRCLALQDDILALRLDSGDRSWLILGDLHGGHSGTLQDEICQLPAGAKWQPVLSSNETRFGGNPQASFDVSQQTWTFVEPEVLVLEANTSA